MGEIRIVGPGKTRGYPYLVCKKLISLSTFNMKQYKFDNFIFLFTLQLL